MTIKYALMRKISKGNYSLCWLHDFSGQSMKEQWVENRALVEHNKFKIELIYGATTKYAIVQMEG